MEVTIKTEESEITLKRESELTSWEDLFDLFVSELKCIGYIPTLLENINDILKDSDCYDIQKLQSLIDNREKYYFCDHCKHHVDFENLEYCDSCEDKNKWESV